MNKTKIKTMLMFALAILGGSVWAESGVQVPSPSYWASFNGSLDSDKVESQGGFSLSGNASEYVDVGASESENKAWSVAGDRWGSQTVLVSGSDTFTLSVTAKLGTVANGVLLSFVNNNSEKRGLVLRRGNENQMIVTTGTSTDPVITANVPNCGETYNNYVLVADSGELTLYVNGEPVKNENGEIVAIRVEASDLIPGSNFQPGRRFGGVFSGEANGDGAIDEMTVWKTTALSAEQVKAFYGGDYEFPVVKVSLSGKEVTLTPEVVVGGKDVLVEITVDDGSSLTIGKDLEFYELKVICDGSASVVVNGDVCQKIGLLNVSGISSIATLITTDLLKSVPKSQGFEKIRKVGDSEETIEANFGFAGAQLIVENGTVIVNSNFQNIIATEESPLIVTGEGSKIRFVSNQSYDRMPNSGYVKALDGAVVELEGANLFSGDNGPNIVLDGSVLRTVATSGGHIKIQSVALMNGSTLEMSGAQTAYNSEGLVVRPSATAKISVSGKGNVIKYADGATENKLFVDGGVIDVAEGGELEISVLVSSGIVKEGVGKLTLLKNASVAKVDDGEVRFGQGGEMMSELCEVASGAKLIFNVSSMENEIMSSRSFAGEGTIVVDGVTRNFAGANFESFAGNFEFSNQANVTLPAGVEGEIEVPEDCILKLALSAEQKASGYTSRANGKVSFVEADGVTSISSGVNGNVYMPPIPRWTATGENDLSTGWSSVPAEGSDVILDYSNVDGDITVSLANFTFGKVTLLGGMKNKIVLNGINSIEDLDALGNVDLSIESLNKIPGDVSVRSESFLGILVEGEKILGRTVDVAGKVIKKGDGVLTLNGHIIPDGGTVIDAGVIKLGINNGVKYYIGSNSNYEENCDVLVKTGAAIDYNGVADSFIRYVSLEAGSRFLNSGGGISEGSRQLKGIILLGDATIETDTAFGLLANSYIKTKLELNGHTLTKLGTGCMYMVNTTEVGTNGNIRVKEGVLKAFHTASTLNGINLYIEGNAALQLGVSIGTCASLKFRPNGSGDGIGFTGLNNLDAAIRPVIDAGLINPESLNVGDTVTLVNGSGLTNNFAEVSVGGRFNEELTEITDAAVTATVGELKNFWHYDFNDGVMSEANAKADDSTYGLSNWGDVNGQDKSIATRNGRAALLYRNSNSQRFSVYWNNNTADKIPFYAGVMTAVSIIKPKATDKRIIWALGSGGNSGAFVALTVDNDNTISMISWANNTLTTLASVSGIKNLTKTFHFVAVEFTPEGTTLWVDDKKVTTDKIFPEGVGKVGQLASVHGNVPGDCGYTRLESDGCYLDDWTVYDAALTDNELKALRSRLTPRPFYIRIR